MEALALAAGVALLVVCLCLGYLAFRRVRLMRGGGVDVCLRRQGPGRRPVVVPRGRDAGAGWHFGVGRYRGNELAWYRLTSLRPGPTVIVNRIALEIVDRREPTASEVYALPPGASVLHCRAGSVTVELAMVPGVLTGFLSWLESTPPGYAGYRTAS